MADVAVLTRRLTREKLAQFLPTHEARKAFEDLQADVPMLADSANALQAEIDASTTRIVALEASVAQLRIQVASLTARVASLELQVSALQDSVASGQSSTDALIAQVAVLTTQLTVFGSALEDLTRGPNPL